VRRREQRHGGEPKRAEAETTKGTVEEQGPAVLASLQACHDMLSQPSRQVQ